ncbi:MAG: DUF2079 domain-containing protein [Candidatus Baldrarchaeia archaeon]
MNRDVKSELLPIISQRRNSVLVLGVITTYGIAFSYLTVLKHLAFRTSLDLGIFEQSLWSALNGLLFWNTGEFGFHFRVHFDPILFLILPLYAIYPSAIILLVLQSIFLGLGAIPLYWLARDVLKSEKAGIVFVILYLLYPSMQGVNWFEFHPECLLPFLIFSAFYFFRKGHLLKYFVFLILALMCKENVALTTVFMGAYGVWINRKKIPSFSDLKLKMVTIDKYLLASVLTIVLSVLWYFLSMKIISLFNPTGYTFQIFWFYLATPIIQLDGPAYVGIMAAYFFLGIPDNFSFVLWVLLGNTSFLSIIGGVLLHPIQVIQIAFTPFVFKSYYLSVLFTPLLYLPLLDPPSLMIAAPWIILNLLSLSPNHFAPVGYQYPALIIPFIFISAVYGFKNLKIIKDKVFKYISNSNNRYLIRIITSRPMSKIDKNFEKIICTSLIIMVITSCFVWTPIWDSTNPTVHDQALQTIAKIIPPYTFVSVQLEIYPHLTHNFFAYPYYYPWLKYDYILADATKIGYYKTTLVTENLLLHPIPLSEAIPNLIESGEYGVLISFNGIILLKRGYNAPPLISL